MEITVSIPIPHPAQKVFNALNKDAFVALTAAAPFPKVKLIEYQGQAAGSKVHLELDFLLYRQPWISIISENQNTIGPDIFWFEDLGTVLPFPFKKWRHLHKVVKSSESSCQIVEQVYFSTGLILLDYLLIPVVKKMFTDRKPIYLKYFNERFLTR